VLRTRRTREHSSPAGTVRDAIVDAVEPLYETARDYDSVLELIGDARFVLIGEASHGTHEFYSERAAITKRLIMEKGFTGVCIEGDWPDAYRVDCYLKGNSDDASAEGALEGFRRFPTWMWRNEVVRDFVNWLRPLNDLRREQERVGFYGLDLYSMYASMQAVLRYLDRVDPDAAKRARHRYACFEHFADDSQAYGYASASNLAESCEQEAVRELVDLRSHALEYVTRDGRRALDDFFSAEQNARLVQNAEFYYRAMFRGRVSSWNLRDRHMAETLDAIERHLRATGRMPKLVVWAHNSHLGDARYTDMSRRGELNLGQIARERYGGDVRLIGFSTHMGTVTAAHDWDEPGMQRRVRPSLQGSYERVLHDVSVARVAPRFLLTLRDENDATRALENPRLQRAIGVIYRPETERQSHYYDVVLPRQFDAMIHLDETTALRALEPGEHWERGVEEPPETFPSGF
jgi:erythromycin esterase-like protein